jgi:hypothetical protein
MKLKKLLEKICKQPFIHQVTQPHSGLLVQNQPNMKMLTASITIEESALSLIEDKDYNSIQSSNDSNLRNPPESSNPTLERQQ